MQTIKVSKLNEIRKLKLKFQFLLTNTERKGINELLELLEKKGFFSSPASSKYHGCYYGGLLTHSMNVYEIVKELVKTYNVNFNESDLIIPALLHDICKMGAYIQQDSGAYIYNRNHAKNHGLLSIELIENYIELKLIERYLILFHMGEYGTFEFFNLLPYGNGEYSLKELTDKYNEFPIIKLFHIADELATLKEKNEEK